MTPLRLFYRDMHTLEYKEIIYPTYVQVIRWVVCNVEAYFCWLTGRKMAEGIRYPARRFRWYKWRTWGLHEKITLKGQLR